MLSSYTNLNDPNDASAIGNMLKAIDLIAECNALRKAEGLPELYVSDYAMAVAIVNTNWSAANLKKTGKLEHVANHGGNRGWAENINAGYTDAHTAYEGWYWNEKANALGHAVTDPATGKVYQPGGSGGQTGHYENIVEGSYTVTGAAWNATGFNGRPVMGQEFRGKNGYTQWLWGQVSSIEILENIYTVDAYRARLLNAMNGAGNAQLQAQIDQLLKEIEGIDGQIGAADLAGKQGAYEAASAEQAAAEHAVTDHTATEPGLADASAKLDAAKAEAKRAEEAKRAAEANLNTVTGEVTAKKAEINAQLAAKREELKAAQDKLPGLEAAKNQAASELEAIRGQYADIVDASGKLDAAKANLDAAGAALAQQQAAIKAAEGEVAKFEAELKAAEADVAAKAHAAATAGTALADKQAAMDEAKAVLDTLKAKLGEFQAKVDTAKADATAKAAAKTAADKLVADLAAKMEAGKATLADAQLAADNATELEAAWGKFLHAYDPTDMVVNGSIGVDAMPSTDASVREAIHAAVEEAHAKYEAAKTAEADAKAALDAAAAKLETTRANAEATKAELADAEAEYAQAKAAYDKVVAFLAELEPEAKPEAKPETKPEQAPVQQQVAAKPNKVEGAIPQTGDASGAAIAATAAAGLSMVGVAEILRRRREAQNRA